MPAASALGVIVGVACVGVEPSRSELLGLVIPVTPPLATVRTVSYLSAFFVLAAVVAHLLYVAVLVPGLPDVFELDISGRSPTSHIMVTPEGVATGGWVFVVVGAAAAVVTLVTARSRSRLSYVLGAIDCVILPGFSAGLLANAFAARAGVDGPNGAPVVLALGCLVGLVAVLSAPKLTRRTQAA